MFDTVKIGKRIAELRKKRDMTQFEIADRLGISYQAVSKLGAGQFHAGYRQAAGVGRNFWRHGG